MKIALYGATGMIGQRILAEAVSRGHEVTAIVRNPEKIAANPKVAARKGDITDAADVAEAVKGHDAVVSAYGPPFDQPELYTTVARALIEALPKAGVKRLLVVGGAGSLEVAPGVQLVDTPEFPAAWKAPALGHRDSLNVIRDEANDLDWSYLSPAAIIEPGERTGKFRLGKDQLVTDDKGESHISAEDFAIAVLDELESPNHIRSRFTLAY